MFGLPPPVKAGAAILAASDAKGYRKVVEARLEAFAEYDPKRAFSCASTVMRARFGDATTFIAMLRGTDPMLVRPAAASFSLPQAQSGAVPAPSHARQKMQFRDREGHLWVASCVVERQAGADWRISGCMVVADNRNAMA